MKALIVCLLLVPFQLSAQLVEIIDHSPQAAFAAGLLEKELAKENDSYPIRMLLDTNLEEQAFSIKTRKNLIEIRGGDNNGLMYGALELLELVQLRADLSSLELSKTPFLKKRGLKFNIPLDARCPSYDDTGDAAQRNIENMWDMDFWKSYFDHMARYRYNVLSLWSPNPFQVMLKLPEYPDLALDDVCRTTSVPRGKVGEWSDAGGVNAVVLDNLEVIKEISIDEKVTFWQEVFTYAASRGVDVYFYTWNIYTNGTFGKYGLTDEIANLETKAYYRHAIKVFLETYPQIKGIGVTAGERMHVTSSQDVADVRERWLWEAYGLGILDYKKEHPDREVHFVHRVWYSQFDRIMKYWKDYPDPFEVGYKYVKARIYSSPLESPFIGSLKLSLEENSLKCWWNLRNDDIFVYRWGDPDYVREFLGNLPKGITAGYHMGPDGYVFGRVFSDKDPEVNGSMEFEKHWYKFMLWGRLGYDNNLSNEFFKEMLAKRYADTDEHLLFKTWQTASRIIPQVNRYMFHSGDRHWSPEMCASRESFKYTPYFRIVTPMTGSGIINPKTNSLREQKGLQMTSFISPDQVSDSLIHWGGSTLSLAGRISGASRDLENVIEDITAMAWLGMYYGYKIKAAHLLEQRVYDENPVLEDNLEKSMHKATEAWSEYARISDRNYFTQMYSRVNIMDWKALMEEVKRDQELVMNLDSEQSLQSLQARNDEEISVFYPYRNDKRFIQVQSNLDGLAHVAVFDERDEMVNYYVHPCPKGNSRLVWEDLAWLPAGKYTMILEIEGRTASHSFTR